MHKTTDGHPANPSISPLSLTRNGNAQVEQPRREDLKSESQRAFSAIVEFVEERSRADGDLTFRDFECELREHLFELGRALVVRFLADREAFLIERGEMERFEWLGRRFRPAPPIARNLTTLFGVVRYWRTYMREVAARGCQGFHPLDLTLGLTADRLSWNVLSHATRLATQLPYATARSVLSDWVPNTPSTEVIEKATLGFGGHAEAWFEKQQPPDDDGEVLVLEFDGKAVPTATERELERRRGKRAPGSGSAETSPRHRGRQKRGRHPSQPRRHKGDKAKNGKMATMVVMYTLKRRGTRRLEGPINRRHYVSLGSKRHAFEVARREAEKRGFGVDSGRLVQVVTDGDRDYEELTREYLPHARHDNDCYHVFEKLWEAGAAFLPEGSAELKAWVDEQKARLFEDDVDSVLDEMQARLDAIPLTGPGNKGRRQRLGAARRYLEHRRDKILYGSLRRRDLVIATGNAEGAVRHVIANRCDSSGMRWIKERAQAVLQLRCIEINGDWAAFEAFVHDRLRAEAALNCAPQRLQTAIPKELPRAA
jgi:hypothetical protein